MTAPVRPAVDPTELTPEQWQQYLANARAALKENPQDREALHAIQDANFALNVYDEAAAASPSERVKAGVTEGAKGLGQAALDIPSSIVSMILHPVQTVKNLPKVPGALIEGMSSDDPATVSRTVGNIGSILLPGAKVRGTAAARIPSALARGVRAVTPPIVQSLATKVTPPIMTNAVNRLTMPPAARPIPPVPGLLGIGEDIGAMPQGPPPPISVTRTPPVGGRAPSINPADELASPTFLRRGQAPPALSSQAVAGLRRLLANPRTSAELKEAIRIELARHAAGH